ncbi:hypothetical protein [Azotobacter salinestris]|uniref:hypothetical protein n=1 Tax=Azotobacter salinestris TaxID=69964 RepID=UPI0032DFFE08
MIFVGLLDASAFVTIPPLQMWGLEKAQGNAQAVDLAALRLECVRSSAGTVASPDTS